MGGGKNNRAAIDAALLTHHKDLWRFALGLSGRRDVADDLTQATAIRAIERASSLTDHRNLRAWLLTICRSIWLNEIRANAIRTAQSLGVGEGEVDIAGPDDTEMNIFAREVLSEVMGLPEAQREIVLLVYVLGYKYREAAEMLEVPIGTVMSRLSVARTRLAHLDETHRAPVAQGQRERT